MEAIASADVVVVGCGIIGLAAAERLAARNLSVALVDELGVANGPTGVSGALVRAFEMDPAVRPWAMEGTEVYLRRGWRGRWPEVRLQGSLAIVAATELEPATAAAAGIHGAEILAAGDACSRAPGLALSPDLLGVYEPRAGWLPAREVAIAVLQDAGPGITILGAARALAVLAASSRVTGVRTTAGVVSARAVLLAAGAASTDLALTVGVDLPLRNRAVSYCVFKPRGAGPGCIPTMVDRTTGAWFRRWDCGTAVLAGVTSRRTDVPPVVRPWVPAAEQRRIREVVADRLPGLASADVAGGVTAFDAMSPAGHGAVTAWPDPCGLVTATGWNGAGFKLAPAVGRLAAERIQEAIS